MGNNCSSKSVPVQKNTNESQWAMAPDSNPDELKNFSTGKFFENQGEYWKAIESYNLATKINPQSSMSHSGLGNCYLKQGDYPRSVDAYKKALTADPNNKFACNGLASAYACILRKDDAIQYYNKALMIDPNFAYPYNGLGNLHYNNKDYSNALSSYENALKCDPNNPMILANLACTHAKLGKSNEGERYFKMAESAAYNSPDMSLSTNHYLKSKLAEYQAATGGSQNVYTQQNVTIQQKAL